MTQFEIAANSPDVRLVDRSFAVGAVVMLGLVWAPAVLGHDPIGSALLASTGLIVWPPLIILGYRWTHGGVASIGDNEFVVKHRAGRTSIPWSDVRRVRVLPVRERTSRIVTLLSGIEDDVLVEVELRKPLKLGRNPTQRGTNAGGVSFGKRTMQLFLKDPDAFVQAASAHLAQG